MEKKAYTLKNLGMNRDMSISKDNYNTSDAYENRNIRITARDHDTLLSVTNERGTKEIILDEIKGDVIGWNVLNNHIILFTHEDKVEYVDVDVNVPSNAVEGSGSGSGSGGGGDQSEKSKVDRIYRIDYVESTFKMIAGAYGETEKYTEGRPLFEGNLNFHSKYPIESVVYSETEKINKIYWVDGRNVLRFMDFTTEGKFDEDTGKFVLPWDGHNNYFDSNKSADFGVEVSITKDNSGSTRANGVIQYLLTYFNKHGQETGAIWFSDLVYLSPVSRGGAPDETNNNKVVLTFSNLDTDFDHFRVYSIFRSSLDGTVTAYLVDEQKTDSSSRIVVDDGAHATLEDATGLLYLGSQPVIAGTLTHKDQTLFLGDLSSTGRSDYSELEKIIKQNMFAKKTSGGLVQTEFADDGETYWSYCVSFINDDIDFSIPTSDSKSTYNYDDQLLYTSSEILSFKGGEKYRFALKFQLEDGTSTDAFWVGDVENTKYPVMDMDDESGGKIFRVIAKCELPSALVTYISNNKKFKTVQLLMAEATYADRSIKTQGILNPTVFNAFERTSGRVYAMPSWISRPNLSKIANKHFQVIKNSSTSSGEIQCNYWSGDTPVPFYRIDYSDIENDFHIKHDPSYNDELDYNAVKIRVGVTYFSWTISDGYIYNLSVYIQFGYRGEQQATPSVVRETFFSEKVTGPNHGAARQNMINRLADYLLTQGLVSYAYRFNIWSLASKSTNPGAGTQYQPIGWEDLDLAYENISSNAYFVKQYMFIDENVLTLDSPEIFYNKVNVDKADYKLRIVGFAEMNGNTGDYVLTATNGKFLPNGLDSVSFSSNNFVNERLFNLTAWPLWKDYKSDGSTWDTTKVVHYWTYMWNQVASISGNQTNQAEESAINHKVFANKLFSYKTVYSDNKPETELNALRQINNSTKMTEIKIGTDTEIYSSSELILSMPLTKKYPVFYSDADEYNTNTELQLSSSTVTSGNPVQIKYDCSPHLVLSLPTTHDNNGYTQVVLPGSSDSVNIPNADTTTKKTNIVTPWHDKGIQPKVLFYITNWDETPSGSSLQFPEATQISASDYVRVTTTSNNFYDAISTLKDSYTGEIYVFMKCKHLAATIGSEYIYEDVYYYGILNFSGDNIVNDGPYSIGDLTVYYTDIKNIQQVTPSEMTDEAVIYQNITITASGYTNTDGVATLHNGVLQSINGATYFKNIEYKRSHLNLNISPSREYMFIGEIFQDFGTGYADSRYGGVSEDSIKRNRFVVAGPSYKIKNDLTTIYGTQGDTYIQRWDALRTTSNSSDTKNGVIDIVSVMLETHTNIAGRCDNQRELKEIASIDTTKYGQMNDVYSQRNNYSVARDLDEDFNTDAYRSSITWTLPKSDMADTDEWTHITLASTHKLDADKGICRALRRLQNSIVAFQDRGIAEVLFNSRTQLSTQDGVPVEIANTGKVDGKRYITNKYGCTNKWSIVEGKSALYFVDNMNKAFCYFDGKSMTNLSSKLGFYAWFRKVNTLQPWTPKKFENFVSFFDRIHSDVYLVSNRDDAAPALVYNEELGVFTSFFDYKAVKMMVNVEDKFVSCKPYNPEPSIVIIDFCNWQDTYTFIYDGSVMTLSYPYLYSENTSGITIYTKNKCFKDAFIAASAGYPSNVHVYLKIHTGSDRPDDYVYAFGKLNIEDIQEEGPISFFGLFEFYSYTLNNLSIVQKETLNFESVYYRDVEISKSSYIIGDKTTKEITNGEVLDSKSIEKLYLQNEGKYGNFFGTQYPYWMSYRVCPDPYGDKIWTNLEYRADFYDVFKNGEPVLESELCDTLSDECYVPNETFDAFEFWNEYQTTNPDEKFKPEKKFRIWRLQIPRAYKNGRKTLDRIRNPWMNMLFKKETGEENNTHLMQLHDMSVIYYE